jgi:hypothetical protein
VLAVEWDLDWRARLDHVAQAPVLPVELVDRERVDLDRLRLLLLGGHVGLLLPEAAGQHDHPADPTRPRFFFA